MRIKTQICLIIAAGLLLFSGCQPSYSTEMSISLQPAATDKASAEQSKPVNALDTLVVVEKIVAANNLKRYTPDTTETFLLDLADTDDLMEDGNSTMTNTTHYKHPDLPVYLSVTRNQKDILVLVNHIPDDNGKPIPNAKKLYDILQKQLADQLPKQ